MLRTPLLAASFLALGTGAFAQSNAQLLPVPGVKHAGTYHYADGQWARGADAKIAYAVIFDNTCTGRYYTVTEQIRVLDDGRVPSTSSPQIDQTALGTGGYAATSFPGTADSYQVNYFEIGYCTSVVGPTHDVSFWDCYVSCLDVTAVTPIVTYSISGLPGAAAAGSLACWSVGLDLLNATASFTLQGDCDGMWDGTASLDNFGYSWTQVDIDPSVNSGPLITGDPDGLNSEGIGGTGCAVGANTVFWAGSMVPGVNTEGSGLGDVDSFGFDNALGGGAYTFNGCYWFGGYGGTALNPFTGHYMELQGDAAAAPTEPGTAYCFGHLGSGNICPCGNENDNSDTEGAGCANAYFAAGAKLGATGVASITADTVMFQGSRGQPSNSSMFFQANNNKDGAFIWLDNGVQCAGGGLIRLKVRLNDANGDVDSGNLVVTDRSAHFNHVIVAGETLYYQWWIRENADICQLDDDANTSNGYEITWTP